jgi:hypothetical protein
VVAFITFKNQEGIERCINYAQSDFNMASLPVFKKSHHFEILGKQMECVQAPEPSDLIWENLQISQDHKNRNKIVIITAKTLFLIGVFVIFIYLEQYVVSS